MSDFSSRPAWGETQQHEEKQQHEQSGDTGSRQCQPTKQQRENSSNTYMRVVSRLRVVPTGSSCTGKCVPVPPDRNRGLQVAAGSQGRGAGSRMSTADWAGFVPNPVVDWAEHQSAFRLLFAAAAGGSEMKKGVGGVFCSAKLRQTFHFHGHYWFERWFWGSRYRDTSPENFTNHRQDW
jgi:hypothetical protein